MIGWAKGVVSWRCGDTLYLSIPFTWLMTEARTAAANHSGPVVVGGPAVALVGGIEGATTSPHSEPFDTLAMHNPLATFTTRGCPNRCPFCAIPKIEGDFRELSAWKPAPIVCDNNILASSKIHFASVVDKLVRFPRVDFNQGLDARLFTAWHADQLARLRGVKVRFALDHANMTGKVKCAIDTARAAGLRDFGVYVLIGFNDTPDDAIARLEQVRTWGIRPNPMCYQPLDAAEKDAFVAPRWTTEQLERTMRYYSRLRWLEHIPFDEYRHNEQDDGQIGLPLHEGGKEKGNG